MRYALVARGHTPRSAARPKPDPRPSIASSPRPSVTSRLLSPAPPCLLHPCRRSSAPALPCFASQVLHSPLPTRSAARVARSRIGARRVHVQSRLAARFEMLCELLADATSLLMTTTATPRELLHSFRRDRRDAMITTLLAVCNYVYEEEGIPQTKSSRVAIAETLMRPNACRTS